MYHTLTTVFTKRL